MFLPGPARMRHDTNAYKSFKHVLCSGGATTAMRAFRGGGLPSHGLMPETACIISTIFSCSCRSRCFRTSLPTSASSATWSPLGLTNDHPTRL